MGCLEYSPSVRSIALWENCVEKTLMRFEKKEFVGPVIHVLFC